MFFNPEFSCAIKASTGKDAVIAKCYWSHPITMICQIPYQGTHGCNPEFDCLIISSAGKHVAVIECNGKKLH